MADPAVGAYAIPEEYQGQLDRIALRQQLAQSLIAQGGAAMNRPGQMVSGHYIAPSLLGSFGGLAQQLAGVYMQRNSADDRSNVLDSYQKDRGSDFAAVNELLANGDEAGAIRKATTSKHAQVQAMAKELTAARNKRLEIGAGIASPESGIAALNANDPSKLQPGGISGPTPVMGTDGKPVGTYITDRKGAPHWAPQPNNVSVNMGPKVGANILEGDVAELRKGRPDAQKAAASLPKLAELYDLATNAPLNGGSFADQKTMIQKLGGAVGLDVPIEAANTEYFNSKVRPLIGAMLADTTGRGQVSDSEGKAAMTALPTAGQDPRAMQAVIGALMKSTMATVGAHNKLLDQIKASAPQIDGFNPEQLEANRVNWSMNGNNPALQKLMMALVNGQTIMPSQTPVGEAAAATAAQKPKAKNPKEFTWGARGN